MVATRISVPDSSRQLRAACIDALGASWDLNPR